MFSVLQILAVQTKDGTIKRGPKAGEPYSIKEAHCVILNDKGEAQCVGVLQVPKRLEESAKPGHYTASFALEAPTFGDNQGKIIATLAGLVPINPAQLAPKPAAPTGARP